MPANLFRAKAQNIKPLVLTIIVKFFLDKPRIQTVHIQTKATKHQLVNQKINRLLEKELNKSVIRFQGNKNYCSICSNLGRSKCDYEIDRCSTIEIALKSHQTLLNLAKVNFEEKIIDTFINHLYHPNLLQTEIINNIVTSGTSIIKIISSFSISERKKNQLTTAVQETITTRAKIRFEIQTDLRSRIELHTRFFKIHWNFKYYLIEIETTSKKSPI